MCLASLLPRQMKIFWKDITAKGKGMVVRMNLQVLAAAVDQDVKALAEKMNLRTEAVIVNQCDYCGYEEFEHKGSLIRCFFMSERGVGLNRNTALLHAAGDIVLFSDEDIHLYDGYEKTVLDAFEQNPHADLITFNFKVAQHRSTYYNKENRPIHWYNYGRYPTFSVAARLEALRKANVSFSLLFGGGARYSNGEDSLFLHDCLKKGLRLWACTEEIGEEIYRESTWFKGYNEKFFVDRGVLYHYLYGRAARLFSLRFLYAHRAEMCREIPLKRAYELMKKGIVQGRLR